MCTSLRRIFSDLLERSFARAEPSLREMSLSLSQSDSQLARNEQLASPVLGMHLWHNELRPSDNSDEHDDYDDDQESRGEVRGPEGSGRTVGPRQRSREERDRAAPSCWYFSTLQSGADILEETLTLRPVESPPLRQRSVTTKKNTRSILRMEKYGFSRRNSERGFESGKEKRIEKLWNGRTLETVGCWNRKSAFFAFYVDGKKVAFDLTGTDITIFFLFFGYAWRKWISIGRQALNMRTCITSWCNLI